MTIQLFYLYVNSQDCPVPKKFSDTLGEWESRPPKIFWWKSYEVDRNDVAGDNDTTVKVTANDLVNMFS